MLVTTPTPDSSDEAVLNGPRHLQSICAMRAILLIAQLGAFLFITLVLEAELNVLMVLLSQLSLLTVTIWTFWRSLKPWPLLNGELFLHILIDVLLLSVWLYYTGGSTNPLISYFLVDIATAAAVLPAIATLGITLSAIIAYSVLMSNFIPINVPTTGHSHANHNNELFNVHIIGMWFSFVISAIVMSAYVVRMAKTLRIQQAKISEERESSLRNEQILAVGLFAANAAHELGTPLSTLSILSSDIQKEAEENNRLELAKDMKMIGLQVERCRNSLNQLVQASDQTEYASQQLVQAEPYFKEVLESWSMLRPKIRFNFSLVNNQSTSTEANNGQPGNTALISVDRTMKQALLNLLNNAADAADSEINIELSWTSQLLTFAIQNDGQGLDSTTAQNLGKAFYSTKKNGMGLGLFLSEATIKLHHGSVRLYANKVNSSTITEITLPCRTSCLNETEMSQKEALA